MNIEELKQIKFEKTIELLILYKQHNLLKEVYLSEKSISEAFKWYQDYIGGLAQNIQS